MKLFLIRHGETVDNVAQVYAGIKDSCLTNHGFLQANRLGKHFAANSIKLTEIFSSDLQRASKTAEALRVAQPSFETAGLVVTQLTCLQEQNFGFYEGKIFSARPRNSKKSGKEAHRDEHKNDPGFEDVESKESMGARANSFLDDHLLPLLRSETIERQHNIAVVSHGIILSMLWRCLLKRFAARTIAFTPGLHVGSASTILEYLGGWSNTGYLELSIEKVEGLEPLPLSRRTEEGNPPPLLGSAVISEKPITHVEENSISTNAAELASPPGAIDDLQTKDASSTTDRPEILYGWKMTIRAINCKDHLKGLKRTGGGVGSSQFDEGQKKIETFFKKRKTS